MGIFDDRQLRSHVRIFNGEVPIGSGFVVGDRKVMTCAHVVGDSAGRRAELRDRPEPPVDLVVKLDMPFAPGHAMTARVTAKGWRPESSRQIGKGLDDAAVLELEPGQSLPPGARPIGKAWKVIPDDVIRGYGVGLQNPAGVVIRGRNQGLMTLNRFTILADAIDEAIRPGCSGAAAWSSAHPGVAGMVVEMQQERTGRIIPVDVLEEICPLSWEDQQEGSPARRPTATGGRAVQPRLKELLRDFDRDPQIGGFIGMLGEDWDRGRKPIVCTIAGLEPDKPDWCRDKCRRMGLNPRFRRLKIQAERVDMIPIAWPETVDFNHESEFAGLLNTVKAYLDPRTSDPDGFRNAYNRSLAPRIFYSKLDERILREGEEPHRRLLESWIDFWAKVGSKPLKKPFVHFLLLTLESRADVAGRDHGAYRIFYERLLAGAGVDQRRGLPLLRCFGRDEIDVWIENIADDLRLSKTQLYALREQVGALFRSNSSPRLADLESWVDGMSL